MYKITWDKETGGVLLHSRIVDGTLGVSPRPVFFEELDLLKLDELGWKYPRCQEPLLWACNKQYFYQGEFVFEAKGANIYDPAQVIFTEAGEQLKGKRLKPVNVARMLKLNHDKLFLLESEAIEFIHETYEQYARARHTVQAAEANQLDFEALAQRAEKSTKKKMAIVKQDCDSFDIMPLEDAERDGKRVYQTTKVDRFLASYSGGKDSQVVLDLCTRAIPSTDFEVIYSDTGYELPPSLTLYDEIQKYYHAKYPDLKFSVARNHESVLNYWDKIGTPSDSHRWCCTIMKTAPLYKMLKVDDGKGGLRQAKVLTFDGVRAEESVNRSGYIRIGKGKHSTITNAHPILFWNTVEIFLYLFQHSLPINDAYRKGKARVGCLICPFSTQWDEMISNSYYGDSLAPFVNRIRTWSEHAKINNIDEYIKERKWKIKAIGDTKQTFPSVDFVQNTTDFIANVSNAKTRIQVWLHALCNFSLQKNEDEEKGTLKYKDRVFNFVIKYTKKESNYSFTVSDCTDSQLILLLKRVVFKSAYCILCETCEVDCPTGALSILPQVNIDKTKCIHCHKCLDSHDKGCIAADCIRMINDMNKKATSKIQGYKTFGLRSEWIDEFLLDPLNYWKENTLPTPQLDGFKAWLKHAEIIDSKNNLTRFGELIKSIYVDDVDLTWELILVNLSYNSYIINWFANNIKCGQVYDGKLLKEMIAEQEASASPSTISNAVQAFLQTVNMSPIGDVLCYGIAESKKEMKRIEYVNVSPISVAYALYKYAEERDVRSLRVSDFYEDSCNNGPFKVFGISRPVFQKALKTLNSNTNRVLVAELNMGLDSISLRDDLNSLSVLEMLI